MAGKIIADTIESAGSQISLNVGNVTILTASSTGLTLTPTTNVNINISNSSATFTTANITTANITTANVTGVATFTTANITTANVTGVATFSTGTAALPSITTAGDTNTGLYFPAADTIAFTEGGAEAMRINSSGNVGIGTASVVYPLTLGNNKQFGTLSPSGNPVALAIMDSSSNLYLGDSSANSNFLSIQSKSGALFNVDGTQIMRVSSGGVFATSTGGLGYGGGGGAGGTVTQATSKSTAVTLNKNTGQITMSAAALASGVSVIFTLTNSTISATDTLITNHSSTGGTTSSYTIQCLTCAAGSATIRVTNITAGSLSEALVINFAVIKGTTL